MSSLQAMGLAPETSSSPRPSAGGGGPLEGVLGLNSGFSEEETEFMVHQGIRGGNGVGAAVSWAPGFSEVRARQEGRQVLGEA